MTVDTRGRLNANTRLLVVLSMAFLVVPVRAANSQVAMCNGKPATTSGTQGTSGDDVIVGTEGDDTIQASNGNDTVCGLGGDDELIGFMGDDFLDGGAGADRLYGCDPSHGYSDAIVCFQYQPDATDVDDLVGGADDDYLTGHLSNDSLDGGDGYDVLDGGEAEDTCAGERYTRCEAMDPPEPAPACMDGADNDEDGYSDATDPECSRERDPTEDVANDPICFNGNDDDGDGRRDYPEDLGCSSFSDPDEFGPCPLCPPPSLTIEYSKKNGFRGRAYTFNSCVADRPVVVKRVRDGRDLVVGRDRTGAGGRWVVARDVQSGKYYAVAPEFTYTTAEGDEPTCPGIRSDRISV